VRRRARPLRGPAVGLLALGLVIGAGCSSSSDSSSDSKASSSTTRAPEDILVSDAKVASGLASLQGLVISASSNAKTNWNAAKKVAEEAHEQWEKIEGRIKKNDTDAYLQFEDALSDLNVGADDQDAEKVANGALGVNAAVKVYLAKYPG
jgi:hypothetical protein